MPVYRPVWIGRAREQTQRLLDMTGAIVTSRIGKEWDSACVTSSMDHPAPTVALKSDIVLEPAHAGMPGTRTCH